jgi:hypothetical protein
VDVVEDQYDLRAGRGRRRFVDRAGDRPQQEPRIVVAAVERDPRERPRVARAPFAQQRRLAVPGRGDEDGERRPVRGQEWLDQARPANRPAQAGRARCLAAEGIVDPLPWAVIVWSASRPLQGLDKGVRKSMLGVPTPPGAVVGPRSAPR